MVYFQIFVFIMFWYICCIAVPAWVKSTRNMQMRMAFSTSLTVARIHLECKINQRQ